MKRLRPPRVPLAGCMPQSLVPRGKREVLSPWTPRAEVVLEDDRTEAGSSDSPAAGHAWTYNFRPYREGRGRRQKVNDEPE